MSFYCRHLIKRVVIGKWVACEKYCDTNCFILENGLFCDIGSTTKCYPEMISFTKFLSFYCHNSTANSLSVYTFNDKSKSEKMNAPFLLFELNYYQEIVQIHHKGGSCMDKEQTANVFSVKGITVERGREYIGKQSVLVHINVCYVDCKETETLCM